MGKTDDRDREEGAGVVATARGWFDSGWTFLREVVQEGTKVTWPNRKEALGSTAIIILVVLLVGVYLGMVDYVLTVVVQQILG